MERGCGFFLLVCLVFVFLLPLSLTSSSLSVFTQESLEASVSGLEGNIWPSLCKKLFSWLSRTHILGRVKRRHTDVTRDIEKLFVMRG